MMENLEWDQIDQEEYQPQEGIFGDIRDSVQATLRNTLYYATCIDLGIPFLSKVKIEPRPSQQIWLLGKHYQQWEQFYKDFQKLAYFSYRKKGQYSKISDMGWGCMIRSMQMLICNILLKRPNDRPQIINQFLQNPKASFSLLKICNQLNLDMREKNWISCSQASRAFSKVIREIPEFHLVIFSCIQLEINGFDIYQQLEQQTSVLLVLHYRLSFEELDQRNVAFIQGMMEIDTFRGALGGIQGKAEFLVGKSNDNYIGLDPHFVQQYCPEYEKSKVSQFSPGIPRGGRIQNLSSSISFTFLIQSGQSLQLTSYRIMKLQEEGRCCFYEFKDIHFKQETIEFDIIETI